MQQQREAKDALMAENRQIALVRIIAIRTSSALFTPLTTSIGRFGPFLSICAICVTAKEMKEDMRGKRWKIIRLDKA